MQLDLRAIRFGQRFAQREVRDVKAAAWIALALEVESDVKVVCAWDLDHAVVSFT
jgi:hypothetical protein